MDSTTLISIIIAFAVGAVFTFVFLKQKKAVKDPAEIEREARLEQMVKDLRDQLKDTQKDNSAIREHLIQATQISKELHASTEGLRNLLSNNRLRGDWGEQVAEDLLLGAGFVEEVNYQKQKSTVEGRPDFTLLLPDGHKLNVDAKFPFDDLVAYQEAKSDADRKKHLAAFEAAIKQKVREITSKDYINPEQGTLDFVIMFIPNEMIFSFIYEKLPKTAIDYANERKVVMTGPFGFTALARLVLQSYKYFRYEKNLRQILGLIGQFQEEYAKFSDKLQSLGRQLETTQKTYDEVEGTRSRRLTKVVDKINQETHQAEGKTETPQLVSAVLDEEEE